MKNVIDIKREVEMLSTPAKKAWKQVLTQIEIMATEEGLSASQKNALIQRKLVAARYMDLKQENQYHAQSNDELAKRKIETNMIKMAELDVCYRKLENEVKGIEARLDNRIENINNKTNKK